MSNFNKFVKAIQDNCKEMVRRSTRLYEVEINKDEFWETYLKAFPEGSNPIYRTNTVHDCSCCRHFIKGVGNLVAIVDGKVRSLWDVDVDDEAYQIVANAMSDYVKSKKVKDVFVTNESSFGESFNYGDIDGMVVKFNHFYLSTPGICLNTTRESVDTARGMFRDVRNVFKRSLDEFSVESVETVLELVYSNSLYRGAEWKNSLEEFLKYKKEYDKLTTEEAKELFAWENSVKVGSAVGKIRNHSIGTLLIDICNDMDIDEAVKRYERVVAPDNYKRPNAIFTKKMLEDAKKTIAEMGFMESLERRYATLDDITVNNILFSNKDSAKRIHGASGLFDELEKDVKTSPKKFTKVDDIHIDDFIKNVLPTARELEVFLEGKHVSNMVSLIAPVNKEAPSMMKWDNPFSWAYSGNMTDSAMKERVKAAGGKVDGDLRFSIQWNDKDGYDANDLDAHCIEANGTEIFFGSYKKPRVTKMGGQLDVDIIHPKSGVPAVENITWPDRTKMMPGTYKMFVHCYSHNGGRSGFRAEIEFDGQIYSFEHPAMRTTGQKVHVADVILDGKGNFSIKEDLKSTNMTSRDVWGLSTNQFVPVSVVCYSPNYWNSQNGIGNKHYFFMLKDCVNPEKPNGWYNEFLNNELVKHKRVFEALGSKAHVQDTEDQLSGVGFSSTKRAELVVKVIGQTERIMKVKF